MKDRDPSTQQNIRPLSANVTYGIHIQIHMGVNRPRWLNLTCCQKNNQEGSPKRLHGKIAQTAACSWGQSRNENWPVNMCILSNVYQALYLLTCQWINSIFLYPASARRFVSHLESCFSTQVWHYVVGTWIINLGLGSFDGWHAWLSQAKRRQQFELRFISVFAAIFLMRSTRRSLSLQMPSPFASVSSARFDVQFWRCGIVINLQLANWQSCTKMFYCLFSPWL